MLFHLQTHKLNRHTVEREKSKLKNEKLGVKIEEKIERKKSKFHFGQQMSRTVILSVKAFFFCLLSVWYEWIMHYFITISCWNWTLFSYFDIVPRSSILLIFPFENSLTTLCDISVSLRLHINDSAFWTYIQHGIWTEWNTNGMQLMKCVNGQHLR